MGISQKMLFVSKKIVKIVSLQDNRQTQSSWCVVLNRAQQQGEIEQVKCRLQIYRGWSKCRQGTYVGGRFFYSLLLWE